MSLHFTLVLLTYYICIPTICSSNGKNHSDVKFIFTDQRKNYGKNFNCLALLTDKMFTTGQGKWFYLIFVLQKYYTRHWIVVQVNDSSIFQVFLHFNSFACYVSLMHICEVKFSSRKILLLPKNVHNVIQLNDLLDIEKKLMT